MAKYHTRYRKRHKQLVSRRLQDLPAIDLEVSYAEAGYGLGNIVSVRDISPHSFEFRSQEKAPKGSCDLDFEYLFVKNSV
jgi:hypothetical protein